MKSRFLFPTYFKIIGWALAIPGFVLGYLILYQKFSFDFLRYAIPPKNFMFIVHSAYGNFTDEIVLTLVIVGLLFIAFSREKIEDELVARLRLDALYWAILVNYLIYIILISLNIFFDGHIMDIFDLDIYNLFTPLLIFVTRFYYLLNFKKDSYIISEPRFLPNSPYRKIGIIISLFCISIFALSWIGKLNNLPFKIEDFGFPGAIIGLLVWGYSRSKNEDELTMQYRLESMQLAVFVNFGLLLIANFAFYSLEFLTVMTLNFISLLLFFVIRFTYVSTINRLSEMKGVRGGLQS